MISLLNGVNTAIDRGNISNNSNHNTSNSYLLVGTTSDSGNTNDTKAASGNSKVKMKTSATQNLEEECLDIIKHSAKLWFIRVDSTTIRNAQYIELSNPLSVLQPEDFILRGNAAKEFLHRIKNGENPDKVFNEIEKKYPSDILKVTDTNSREIVDFLSKIEQYKLLNMLDYKIKHETAKLQATLSEDPNVNKSLQNYKTQKIQTLKDFMKDIEKPMNYSSLIAASKNYTLARRALRNSEFKSWDSKKLTDRDDIKDRIDNWGKKGKADFNIQ